MADPKTQAPRGRCRRHGAAPWTVAVLHGGPGAAGEVAPVVEALSARRGVLEPHQRAPSVAGQLAELAAQLDAQGAGPLALVGHAWGAWLAWLFAARHPERVTRLVLVSAPPFAERYAGGILPARMRRLDPAARREVAALLGALDLGASVADVALTRFAAILERADAVDPLPQLAAAAPIDPTLYRQVWPEATALRRSGALLEAGRLLRCPVVAIHGADDPHPAAGVTEPLGEALADFRAVVLPECGHRPWLERQARAAFFEALEAALAAG